MTARAFAPLPSPFRQPAQGNERRGPRAGGSHGIGAVDEPTLLNLSIVEIAEHSLQLLERAENPFDARHNVGVAQETTIGSKSAGSGWTDVHPVSLKTV